MVVGIAELPQFFSLLSGAIEIDFLKGVLGGLIFWVFSASVTAGAWL